MPKIFKSFTKVRDYLLDVKRHLFKHDDLCKSNNRLAKRNAKEKKKLRKRILERDGNLCWLCGKIFENKMDITLDHIIPVSKNGSNAIENLKLAHDICNKTRGNT